MPQVKPATRHELGDRMWEVEWCTSCDSDGFGGCDPDTAKYARRLFKTRDDAIAFAKTVFAKSFFGAATVTEMEFTDPYGDEIRRTFYWQACGDSEEISEP